MCDLLSLVAIFRGIVSEQPVAQAPKLPKSSKGSTLGSVFKTFLFESVNYEAGMFRLNLIHWLCMMIMEIKKSWWCREFQQHLLRIF